MIATANITDKLDEVMEQVREIVVLLKTKQNEEGLSIIPLKEMAAALKVNRNVAKERIDRLAEFGLVKKSGSGTYKLIQTELQLTPFGTLSELARVITEMPNSTYEEQAAALGMTSKELEAAYGLLIYLLRF